MCIRLQAVAAVLVRLQAVAVASRGFPLTLRAPVEFDYCNLAQVKTVHALCMLSKSLWRFQREREREREKERERERERERE